MPLYIGEPGSPEWWLSRLSQRLLDRSARYNLLERYYLGDHPTPIGDWRYRNALRILQKKARTNYLALIADSPVERMRVEGFRFGLENNQADADAQEIWEFNDMDLQSSLVHLTAAVFGDGYVMVAPPQDGDEWPLLVPEDPRQCVTEADPVRPRRTRASLKMFIDEMQGVLVALVMTDDWIAQMSAPSAGLEDSTTTAAPKILHQELVNHLAWRMDDFADNPWGVNPIVRFPWRPTFNNDSRGEFEGLIDIQDRINATVLDRMIISRAQAYKQRWAKGINVEKDAGGKAKPPFDPGADILWATPSKEADFGEFKEADLRQTLEAVRADVEDLAAISKTPPHYLIGEVVNVSGDALKAAETGLVAKVKDRQRSVGAAWEQVMKTAMVIKGDAEKGKRVGVEVIWEDPESRSRAELADAVLKESTIGVPFSLLMERLQYSPAQIERAKVERQAEELRKTQQQIQQQKMLISAGVVADPTKPAPGQGPPEGKPQGKPQANPNSKPARADR